MPKRTFITNRRLIRNSSSYSPRRKHVLWFAVSLGVAMGMLFLSRGADEITASLLASKVREQVVVMPTKMEATASRKTVENPVEKNPPPPPISTPQEQPPIHFFGPTKHINDRIDAFSASWLQRTQDFLQMNATEILSCEDAAFLAYWGPRIHKLRMTVDWFDFAIEHLSKWHKMLNLFADSEQAVYQTALTKLDQYLAQPVVDDKDASSFRETIAMIAFQAYKEPNAPEKAYQLTLRSLGATLESLRRAGFGRVVVVGLEADAPLVEDTVRHVQQKQSRQDSSSKMMLGHMQVAFVQGSLEMAKAKWVQKNVPKAAVGGLHKAFTLAAAAAQSSTTLSQSETDYIQEWLGSSSSNNANHWKYVYLTEPDCILHAKHLSQLKQQVDQGRVLTPHRLQPIPHESDAQGSSQPHYYLPHSFGPVLEVDTRADVCCDDWKGHGTKPGLPPLIPDCGNFWYMCDFLPNKYQQPMAHQRLKPYGLMRLQQGTGIVSLAASEHGRPCKPQKGGVCPPKT